MASPGKKLAKPHFNQYVGYSVDACDPKYARGHV
jgi:hypothetical protein